MLRFLRAGVAVRSRGSEAGDADHQSLAELLPFLALCAEPQGQLCGLDHVTARDGH